MYLPAQVLKGAEAFYDIVRDVFGVRGHETYAFYAFDLVHLLKELRKTGLSAEKNYFKEISKNDDVIVINDIEVHTANVYEYEEENENITGKAYVFTTESEILAIVFYGNGVAAKEASENIINTLTIKNW